MSHSCLPPNYLSSSTAISSHFSSSAFESNLLFCNSILMCSSKYSFNFGSYKASSSNCNPYDIDPLVLKICAYFIRFTASS